MLLTFPRERAIGHVALVGSQSPIQRVPAQGTVSVPSGAMVWFIGGAEPIAPPDLADVPADALDRVVVSGGYADDALVALSDIHACVGSLTLGVGVSAAGFGVLARLGGVADLVVETEDLPDSGVAGIARLTTLTSLSIGVRRVQAAGAPPYRPPTLSASSLRRLTGLTHLQSLTLGMVALDADAAGAVIAVPTLRELSLPRAVLDPRTLVELPSGMELLDVPRTVLGDTDLTSLARLASLTQLTFDPSSASASSVLALRSALPELTINGEWQAPKLVARALRAATSTSS